MEARVFWTPFIRGGCQTSPSGADLAALRLVVRFLIEIRAAAATMTFEGEQLDRIFMTRRGNVLNDESDAVFW